MHKWQEWGVVAAVAATVMFTNLGGPRLWDRDEPRNAGCAREMLERADWVTPVFNGELRTHKPVLLYWLMMTAYAIFGVNEFAARFWSAALAVGTALATYGIGRRLFSARIGVWAGIAIATSLMFGVAGRAATPDSALIFLSTLSLFLFARAAFPDAGDEGPGSPEAAAGRFPLGWQPAAAIYAVMGAAVLAKGPVGFVLPVGVIGLFLLMTGRPERPSHGWRRAHPATVLRTAWQMRPLTALAVVLLVAGPWYLWVGLRTDGQFLRGFFWEHNVGRAMQPMEGHAGGLWFYPASILVGFFPWSVFALPVVLQTVAQIRGGDERVRRASLFAVCWIAVYLGLFSLAGTKLPSYVTPCYPALALLTGCFVDRLWCATAARPRLWRRVCFGCLMLVGVALLVALPLTARQFVPGEQWLGLLGAVPLLAGLLAWWWSERDHPRQAVAAFCAGAVLFPTLLFGVAAARIDRHQRHGALLETIRQVPSGVAVASYGVLEPSWVFYAGRTIEELPVGREPQSMGAWIEERGGWLPKPPLSAAKLLRDHPAVLIVTTQRHLDHLRGLAPRELKIVADAPYFLKQDRLLLVAPDAVPVARRPAPARDRATRRQ